MSEDHQGLRGSGKFSPLLSEACVCQDLLLCSPWGKFAYCAPVGDVGMWVSHRDLVVSFFSYSLSEWTLDLNTWENTGEAEEELLKCSTYSDSRIEAMVFDAPNPEEVGNEDGVEVHDKVWGASASHLYISIPQTFRVGFLLESLSLRQDISVELLQNLCANVAAERTWAEKGLHKTNIGVLDLEAQGWEKFPEWREKLIVALEQVRWA